MPIKKEKNGAYTVDVSLGFDPITGKRRRTSRRGIQTKKEAEQVYLYLKTQYFNHELSNQQDVSFVQLSENYFTLQQNKHKKIYQINQKYSFDKHILPYFIHAKLKKINYKDILAFQEHLMTKKLSNNSINKLIIILRKIFKLAVDEGVIQKNPCDKVPNLRVEKQEMKFWTPDEVKTFLNAIQENEQVHRVFFTTAYLTGARCGELLALQWKDIDFRNRTIRINKTLHNVRQESFIDTPKTRTSNRTIAINQQLKNVLLQWKESQTELFDSMMLKQNGTSFLFQFKDTTPTRNQFTKKIATICKRCKLTPIRLHDFRHSHVALLIELGEDMTIIKERLGHSTITTTIDTYGHLFPNRQHKLADKLDTVL